MNIISFFSNVADKFDLENYRFYKGLDRMDKALGERADNLKDEILSFTQENRATASKQIQIFFGKSASKELWVGEAFQCGYAIEYGLERNGKVRYDTEYTLVVKPEDNKPVPEHIRRNIIKGDGAIKFLDQCDELGIIAKFGLKDDKIFITMALDQKRWDGDSSFRHVMYGVINRNRKPFDIKHSDEPAVRQPSLKHILR